MADWVVDELRKIAGANMRHYMKATPLSTFLTSLRAGYSAKTARFIGAENLTKPNIAAAIEKARTKRLGRSPNAAQAAIRAQASRLGQSRSPPRGYVMPELVRVVVAIVTADWVVDELRKIAGANMADYMRPT